MSKCPKIRTLHQVGMDQHILRQVIPPLLQRQVSAHILLCHLEDMDRTLHHLEDMDHTLHHHSHITKEDIKAILIKATLLHLHRHNIRWFTTTVITIMTMTIVALRSSVDDSYIMTIG